MSIPPYHQRSYIARNELPATLPDEATAADLSLEQITYDYRFLRALTEGRLIHIDPRTREARVATQHYTRSLPALSALAITMYEQTGSHSAIPARELDPEQARYYLPLYENLLEHLGVVR